jgi:hypothetical protein
MLKVLMSAGYGREALKYELREALSWSAQQKSEMQEFVLAARHVWQQDLSIPELRKSGNEIPLRGPIKGCLSGLRRGCH